MFGFSPLPQVMEALPSANGKLAAKTLAASFVCFLQRYGGQLCAGGSSRRSDRSRSAAVPDG
ncbi:MAG: hypothetical protein VB060_06460 [Oscillibacter sp.]|nr:hypothetical protein [Oscillibacter sp.]MEA4993465.1 hypothetical protein [Oscillibacter sp.]